jgi:hypothetical protein
VIRCCGYTSSVCWYYRHAPQINHHRAAPHVPVFLAVRRRALHVLQSFPTITHLVALSLSFHICSSLHSRLPPPFRISVGSVFIHRLYRTACGAATCYPRHEALQPCASASGAQYTVVLYSAPTRPSPPARSYFARYFAFCSALYATLANTASQSPLRTYPQKSPNSSLRNMPSSTIRVRASWEVILAYCIRHTIGGKRVPCLAPSWTTGTIQVTISIMVWFAKA